MTEVPDGSGSMPRRSTRVNDGGAPVSGALAIVLAVVAVVAGFLILRSITDNGDGSLDITQGSTPAGSDDQTASTGSIDPAAPTVAPTTTVPPLVVTGAQVIVANANTIGGSANAMRRALETGAGFSMVDPVNASSTIGDIDESVIYFVGDDPAAQAVAQSLATVLGGVASVGPMPEVPPTRDGSLNGATVLLMLGNDKAGKTLTELSPGLTGATAATSPPIAGDPTVTSTSAPAG